MPDKLGYERNLGRTAKLNPGFNKHVCKVTLIGVELSIATPYSKPVKES